MNIREIIMITDFLLGTIVGVAWLEGPRWEVDIYYWSSSSSLQSNKVPLCILFIVALPRDLNPYPHGHTPDAPAPYSLIKLHIQPHIGGSHSLLGKFPDLLNGLWSHFLKRAADEKSANKFL